ncbi:MAG: HAMP domain-containing histidine kinase [Pyrinomonadaceae bacterium]|nr:HAMP domain-containing histidine kinase [Pyrinomonadaceae bacterium]
MKPFKLHLKTALLASAVALAALMVALLLISARVANQFQTEQKQLAQLQAENLAEHLSLFPAQTGAGDLKQLTNLVSGSRPNLVAVRVWQFDGANFTEQTAADDSLPAELIPPETQNALRSGSASQIVNRLDIAANDQSFRVFAPIIVENKVDGAVEIVERLDTILSIALGYVLNLSWIALATVLLMTVAFYLLFQSLVYRPLEKLLSAMERAKAGDLSVAVGGKEKIDEFGTLSNNFNQMIGQIREMTGEREKQNEILHEKVQAATAELQRKNEQLEIANLELFRTTRKMSEMERLAATIQTAAQFAHEVGTPLNLISGHAQLLQASLPENSKEASRLQTITAQIERIENIVREMLDRTRFDGGELVPLNLNEVLGKIFDAVEPTLQESRVELVTDLEENPLEISGDAGRLQQVFFNLVKNALDAMPDGGKLEVSTVSTGEKVIVEFADSGVGMSREVAAQIFQPLFTTKERGRGTGLGLVVVKQIMKNHDAEITVESVLGKGTKIKLIFLKG